MLISIFFFSATLSVPFFTAEKKNINISTGFLRLEDDDKEGTDEVVNLNIRKSINFDTSSKIYNLKRGPNKISNLTTHGTYRRLDARTPYLGARLKNDLSRRPVQERPISAPGPRTTYLGAGFKNDLSQTRFLIFRFCSGSTTRL